MSVGLFSIREREIFSTLKELQGCDFVVIGGYAVNAYTLPRFSVDCDLVVRGSKELEKIGKALLKKGYKKVSPDEGVPYSGEFHRYGKKLENDFAVSMDILCGKVSDRMTGASFAAGWIFENSSEMNLKGKTIAEGIKVKIISADALLAMKTISCRSTDIRDVFMVMPSANNKEWIKKEIESRCNFNNRVSKVIRKVTSKQFKDGLSGVYGRLNQIIFEKHKKSILAFSDL